MSYRRTARPKDGCRMVTRSISRPPSRLLLVLISLCWLGCCRSWGQQAPAPTTADLEKRVRELEAIVRQLQAEKAREKQEVEPGAGAIADPPGPMMDMGSGGSAGSGSGFGSGSGSGSGSGQERSLAG